MIGDRITPEGAAWLDRVSELQERAAARQARRDAERARAEAEAEGEISRAEARKIWDDVDWVEGREPYADEVDEIVANLGTEND